MTKEDGNGRKKWMQSCWLNVAKCPYEFYLQLLIAGNPKYKVTKEGLICRQECKLTGIFGGHTRI